MNARGEPSGAQQFGDRREITALFYDLVDSTRLLAHSDLEDFHDLVGAFQERTGAAVRVQGGSINETLGDGGLAYFGYPEPLEDSATAAIGAGLDIVEACRRLAGEGGWSDLHVRIGIATSDVVISAADGPIGMDVTGLAPVLAARLQSLALPDTVVVSDRTRHLARRHFAFRNLGRHALKGFDAEQGVWGVRRRRHGVTRFLASGRTSSRMIGRADELALALDSWRQVVAGQGQTLVVVGEAGIGKSRLAHELFRSTRAARARLFVFQCSPRGTNSALSPIVTFFRSAIGSDSEAVDPSVDQVAALMRREGIADSVTVETIAFAAGAEVRSGQMIAQLGPQRLRERIVRAVRYCIEQMVVAGPIVIAVEDAHWIDPSSRDLLQELVGWIRDKPVLLVLTSREPPRWLDPEAHPVRIALSQLSPAEASTMISSLLPGEAVEALPPEVSSLIHRRTNGVPLYLEELSQWLAGTKDADGTAWVDALSSARISTFETLLSARLGTLAVTKSVAQAASVVGQEFALAHLRAALPDVGEDDLAAALVQLGEAKILVRRGRGASHGYAFRHAMIQEALYGTLLRKARIALHRKIYLAATGGAGDSLPMPGIVLAEHAERANLPGDAARLYIAAAKESFARSAVVESRHLLERALHLVDALKPDDERERLELSGLAALGPIITSTQGTKSAEACSLYERALEIARRRPPHEQAEWFPIYWGWWYTGADFGIQRERAETVMSDLRDVQDAEIQLQVQHCVWAIDFNMGRHDTCIRAVDAGLALYEAGRGRESVSLYGGHDSRACGLGQKGLSLWFKGLPMQARASVEEAVRWAQEIRHVGSIAHALDIEAMFHRYRRDYPALRKTTSGMKRLARRHDLPSLAAKALIFEGWCAANLGHPRRGRKSADKGFAIQREIGTREDFPVYSEMMAEILAGVPDGNAAIALLDEALRDAEVTGHLYWVPELYRRRALVGAQLGLDGREVAGMLERSLQVALDQNAMRLFLGTCEAVLDLGLLDRIDPELHDRIPAAMASVEQYGEMATLLQSIAQKMPAPR